MKNLHVCFLTLAAILLVGCSKLSVQPVSQEILGPLGSYFEIEGESFDIEDGKLAITLTRKKEGMPDPWAPAVPNRQSERKGSAEVPVKDGLSLRRG